MRYAMALDTQACIGCLACTVACKVENGSPEGIWHAPVISHELGEGEAARRAYVPLLCNHCADAPCLKACPTSAIYRRKDGIVIIDQDRCCGSGACVIACPYGAIQYYGHRQAAKTPFDEVKLAGHQPGTAQKCTFCAPRLDRGLKPACIDVCPTGARIFGDLDDPQSAVSKAFAQPDAIPLGAPLDTKPNTRYLARGVRHAGGTDADIALAFRPQTQWGPFHATQFWLFALAGGIAAVSRFAPLTVSAGGRVWDLGAMLAFVLLSAGGLLLLTHLGKPLQFYGALRNWRSSWISRGAIADFFFLALAAFLAVSAPAFLRSVAEIAILPFAALVAVYPALAMGAMRSVPAWSRAALPLKFAADALMAGCALAGLIGGWSVPLLGGLAVLALLRLMLWRRGEKSSGHALLSVGLALALALLALVVPYLGPLAGGLAGFLVLESGLAWRLALLRDGASPSPFGSHGELAGKRYGVS